MHDTLHQQSKYSSYAINVKAKNKKKGK